MATSYGSNTYRKLVEQVKPPPPPSPPTPENELDILVAAMKEREQREAGKYGALKPDALRTLRELLIMELVPAFVELVEKYSRSGISMQMDASNFLEGGREIRFEFGIGEHRTQLLGTVTAESIAFHETQYSPNMRGELVSGPMLRLRTLDVQVFRDFVCERLTRLVRSCTRRH